MICVFVIRSVKVGLGSESTLNDPALCSGAQKRSWLNPEVNTLHTEINRTHLRCTSQSAALTPKTVKNICYYCKITHFEISQSDFFLLFFSFDEKVKNQTKQKV